MFPHINSTRAEVFTNLWKVLDSTTKSDHFPEKHLSIAACYNHISLTKKNKLLKSNFSSRTCKNLGNSNIGGKG